jgi:hypothetical protein
VVVIQHCHRVLAAWKEKRELTHCEFDEAGPMDDIVRISVKLSLIVRKVVISFRVKLQLSVDGRERIWQL